MMALARKIVSGEEDTDAETVEEVFAAAQDAENGAEELLVDEDWRPVEVDPETVSVNGNGHHDRLDIGPTIELVPVNGHSGNGDRDEANEPQKSLFSWAEFMAAEPAKSRGRKRMPQPAAASLFEWALTVEQEREAELVGAGR